MHQLWANSLPLFLLRATSFALVDLIEWRHARRVQALRCGWQAVVTSSMFLYRSILFPRALNINGWASIRHLISRFKLPRSPSHGGAGEAYDQIKEMCIFLLNEFSLPPDKVLAVYIQSPGSPFKYCGAVYHGCPSAVLSLSWPEPGGQMQITSDAIPLTAKIGVSVEDLSMIPALNVGQQQRIEQLAMKVGENLFNFMQSFCTMDANKLVVPTDILDRWFKKFQERAKRDPEYLKSFVI